MFGMNPNFQPIVQPFTNKLIVSSKEEAINRSNQFNSVMLYVIQPSGNIVEVAVDQFGSKTCREFSTTPVEASVQQATSLEDRMTALENKIDTLINGGNKDEQSK